MKRKAFTLAETLITLGIIGVVAAMTLPVLIQKYNKIVWVNQLKKSVSVVENGFKLAMAEDEVELLSDTNLFLTIGNKYFDDNLVFSNFISVLKKYFNITETENDYSCTTDEYKTLSGETAEDYGLCFVGNKVYLNDGTILFIDFMGQPEIKPTEIINQIKGFGGKMYSDIGLIEIDVNGKKNPNQYGRDRFSFILSDNGNIYPYSGIDYALYSQQNAISSNSYYWRNNNDCEKSNSDSIGSGCAARIIENGWKMDY